jgi:hypothetical protein
VTALAVAFFIAAPAQAIESFGIGAVPANPKADNPRTKSIFVYEADKGAVLKDGIRVINNSTTKRVIKAYPVDSERSSDGAFACAQAVEVKKEVGSWIQLDKNEVTLEAGQGEVIPFTVRLPETAEVGEHNGCIAIEEIKPPTESDSNGIVLSFRSALRVAIIVPGEISAKLEFLSLKSENKASKLVVSPTVRNTGNISVDAQLNVTLKNAFGYQVAGTAGQFAILTNDESRFNFEFDMPFWGGWYKMDADASYQPLRLDANNQDKRESTKATPEWVYVAPQTLAVFIYILVPLLVAGAIAAFILRRRHWRLIHQHTHIHRVMAGDTLQKLAAGCGINWKKLAKINGLKPPYTLELGQKIKLPDNNRLSRAKKRLPKD